MKVFRRIDHDAVLSTVKARFLATRTKEQLFKLVRNEMENGNARGRSTIFKIWYDSLAREAKKKLLHYEKEIIDLFIAATKSEDKSKVSSGYGLLQSFVESWEVSDESYNRCSNVVFDAIKNEPTLFDISQQLNFIGTLTERTPEFPGLRKWICDELDDSKGREHYLGILVDYLRRLDKKEREAAVATVARLVLKLDFGKSNNYSGTIRSIVAFFEQTNSKAASEILKDVRPPGVPLGDMSRILEATMNGRR